MNFKEAIIEMDEGKKVRRKQWSECVQSYIRKDGFITYENGNKCPIGTLHLEAEDWFVVDEDKDWNLADELPFDNDLDAEQCIKKCRELIMEDIQPEQGYNIDLCDMHKVDEIINKRFGDL